MRRVLGFFALFVAVLVAANIGLGRVRAAWDLTAEGSASLSAETRRVLREVDRRIEVTAFFARDAVGRVEAATLLSRYRKENRRITFRVLDPQLAPGEAERLGVQQIGSAAVQALDGKESEIAPYTIEIDVTSAIARLIRGVDATVCFTTGHGERVHDDTTAAGMSQAASILEDNGYRLRSIDLLASPQVPRACNAVVVAAPISVLGGDAERALRRYLERDGKAVVLADPAAETDLNPVVRQWGVHFIRGVILEADPGSHLPGDVTAPIIRRYGGGSPVVRGVGPAFFPRAMGVDARGTDDPGITATGIAFTSRLGYLDRRNPGSFDEKVDREGPVSVGVAADASEVSNPGTERARVHRTRIVAWGDVDFATNRFIGEASNARLWIQGLDWLTQPEDLVTAVPNFPKVRDLELTAARSRYLLVLTAGVIPGLFLIAGAVLWVVRRGR